MRAAIYCRISKDAAGEALGVGRQERDCREYCERRSWTIVDTYVDNDLSAYSGKRRPAYEAMLAAMADRRLDVIVVWHPDRLHRSPIELERFIVLVETTEVQVATVTAGDYDLATPEGRLVARIVGSVARKESEDKSRRLRRKHLELAEQGRPSGGGYRAFGYEADGRTLRTDEAAEIRGAVARILAGDSLRGIAHDWQERGVPTVSGGARWSPVVVRQIITGPRIAGQREHHGRILGPADWPAIIDPDDLLRVRALVFGRSKPGFPTARSYLLSGLVWCGRCDVRLGARPIVRKGKRLRRYVCTRDRGGCDRLGIGADGLEELVTRAVVEALDAPRFARVVSAPAERPDITPIADLEDRLGQLAEMFAAGEITRVEWLATRASVERRLDAARARVASTVRDENFAVWAGRGKDLAAAWDDLTFDRRRAAVAGAIERVVIAPTDRRGNRFDANRVTIRWRR